jgi:hypothetical protein
MKLKTYNRKIDKFLSDLDYICQENAVQIIFTNKNYVKSGRIKSSGYFDEDKRILACALKTSNDTWLTTLIHESCHLDQWREKDDVWLKFCESDADKEDLLDKWLGKKVELSKDRLDKMIQVTKEMEWDCEKRAVEKIKKYNLKIDIDYYLKQAIVYVMFYDFVGKTRKWYKPNKSPCLFDNILALIPDNYDLNRLPELTPEIEKLMYQCI